MKTVPRMHLGAVLSASCLLLATLGCMVEPGNLQEIASRSTPIQFSGFTVQPNQKVVLYVQNANNSWTKIGETNSSNQKIVHFDTSWYPWHKEIIVAKAHWRKFGESGAYFVVLKGMVDGNDMMSFKKGFYDYVQDYDSVEELYEDNQSEHGINVLVWATKP
jgi:hypothetical protein